MDIEKLIEEFEEEKEVEYKNEKYKVRDNGAVYRYRKDKLRKYDEKWTFGNKNKSGYMVLSEHRVHIIVAGAFYGFKNSKEYVVDHIDTNRCNNRKENLRWITRLDNMLLNPVTYKKILLCYNNDIEKFLEDPGSISKYANSRQNYDWMRTVSKEEARNSYERVMKWAAEKEQYRKNRGELGEWIFTQKNDYKNSVEYKINSIEDNKNINLKSIQDKEDLYKNDYYTESYTENVIQKNWNTKSYFPLVPKEISNTPLLDYNNNMGKDKIIANNDYNSNSKILKYDLFDNNNKIIVMTYIENSMKEYGIMFISYENNKFIHESESLYFKETGADKKYHITLGIEWKGGDSIDDYL